MKTKLLIVIGLVIGEIFSLSAQDRADQQHLENPNSFSMILLGDPQGYTKYDINQPLFDLCTAWIADNIDNLKIKAVLCTVMWWNRMRISYVTVRCSIRQVGKCGKPGPMPSNDWTIKLHILFLRVTMNTAFSIQRTV